MEQSDLDVIAAANEKKRIAFLEYENGRLQKDVDYKALRIKDLLGEVVGLHQRLGDAD